MAPRMISAVIGSSRRRRRAAGRLGRRAAGRLAIGVPIPRGAVVCARRGRGAVDRRRVGEPARAGGRGGGGQYLRPLRSARGAARGDKARGAGRRDGRRGRGAGRPRGGRRRVGSRDLRPLPGPLLRHGEPRPAQRHGLPADDRVVRARPRLQGGEDRALRVGEAADPPDVLSDLRQVRGARHHVHDADRPHRPRHLPLRGRPSPLPGPARARLPRAAHRGRPHRLAVDRGGDRRRLEAPERLDRHLGARPEALPAELRPLHADLRPGQVPVRVGLAAAADRAAAGRARRALRVGCGRAPEVPARQRRARLQARGDAMKPLAFRPHPWHGLEPGPRCPEIVTAYIEIVPTDGVKYEIDKHSGYLKIDRPQRFSAVCPTLYGFVPQTFCGEAVAAHVVPGGPPVTRGDGDPLDICVLTDRHVSRGEILLQARPIGGLRMVEAGEADDKIIAVLLGDPTFGELTAIAHLPRAVIDRLRHYFLTYKAIPGEARATITVDPIYDAPVARAIIEAARADYRGHFGGATG